MSSFVKSLKFITQYNNRPSKRTVLKASILMTLFIYIIYHLLQGNRGLFALLEMKQVVLQEQTTLDNLNKQYQQLHHRISLLRPNSLDLDILDECARIALNAAMDDEIIINTDEILTSHPD